MGGEEAERLVLNSVFGSLAEKGWKAIGQMLEEDTGSRAWNDVCLPIHLCSFAF